MTRSVVMLDFYGTLARATHVVDIADVVARHGATLPDDLREQWWSGDLDGLEHIEQSRSRDHYVEWQRERVLAMLAQADVHPGDYDRILADLHAGRAERVLEAYAEVPEVLRELRRLGFQLVVCSNWDWDLVPAIEEAGIHDLVDVVMSSAWAGARKPHPRIFEHTLREIAAPPGDVLFVGDTWGPDVEGPRAVGMAAVYLERGDHWPDPTRPVDADRADVACITDLTGVLELL